MESVVKVLNVNHEERQILCVGGKATLNAPLLSTIFNQNANVDKIIHTHRRPFFDYNSYHSWAPLVTVRDSQRNIDSSFYIELHGINPE